jgi:hypothetical protein
VLCGIEIAQKKYDEHKYRGKGAESRIRRLNQTSGFVCAGSRTSGKHLPLWLISRRLLAAGLACLATLFTLRAILRCWQARLSNGQMRITSVRSCNAHNDMGNSTSGKFFTYSIQ